MERHEIAFTATGDAPRPVQATGEGGLGWIALVAEEEIVVMCRQKEARMDAKMMVWSINRQGGPLQARYLP